MNNNNISSSDGSSSRTNFLQIIPRELAESNFFFREAQRRSLLAGRSRPVKVDWPQHTPSELINLFEAWCRSHDGGIGDERTEKEKSTLCENEHHLVDEDDDDDVAWDPW